MFSREDHFLQVPRDARHSRKVDTVVINGEQLMNHCLVSPLKKKQDLKKKKKNYRKIHFNKKKSLIWLNINYIVEILSCFFSDDFLYFLLWKF